VDQLDFLTAGGKRTIAQAALKFVLAEPLMISALPNVYDEDFLEAFAGTSDVPDLSDEEIAKVRELYESNFGLKPLAASQDPNHE